MRRTVAPSAEIQAEIDKLLGHGMVDDPQKMPGELGRLGARLIIQRTVEDEFDQWLCRARYERRPERQRGLRNYDSGLRNGFRPRHVQTAEAELRIETPQARGAAIPFVSKLFPEVALPAAAQDRPAEGAGDRRVRARPVDARCRGRLTAHRHPSGTAACSRRRRPAACCGRRSQALTRPRGLGR